MIGAVLRDLIAQGALGVVILAFGLAAVVLANRMPRRAGGWFREWGGLVLLAGAVALLVALK